MAGIRSNGVPKPLLIEEMAKSGFRLLEEVTPWHGRDYCMVFERDTSR